MHQLAKGSQTKVNSTYTDTTFMRIFLYLQYQNLSNNVNMCTLFTENNSQFW